MRNVADERCREKQPPHFIIYVYRFCKSHILYSTTCFSRKYCRLWDSAEKHCRSTEATGESITRRMRFACWINKAINIDSEQATHSFSTATIFTRKCLHITLYVHCLSLLFTLIASHTKVSEWEVCVTVGVQCINCGDEVVEGKIYIYMYFLHIINNFE